MVFVLLAGLACMVYGIAVMRARTGTSFYAVWLALGAAISLLSILKMSGLLALVPAPLIATGRILAAALLTLLAVTLAMVLSGFREGRRNTHRMSGRRPGRELKMNERDMHLPGNEFNAGEGDARGREYILVLGARVREDGASRVLRYRLERAVHFLKEHPGTTAIVSGGRGSDTIFSKMESTGREFSSRTGR